MASVRSGPGMTGGEGLSGAGASPAGEVSSEPDEGASSWRCALLISALPAVGSARASETPRLGVLARPDRPVSARPQEAAWAAPGEAGRTSTSGTRAGMTPPATMRGEAGPGVLGAGR